MLQIFSIFNWPLEEPFHGSIIIHSMGSLLHKLENVLDLFENGIIRMLDIREEPSLLNLAQRKTSWMKLVINL